MLLHFFNGASVPNDVLSHPYTSIPYTLENFWWFIESPTRFKSCVAFIRNMCNGVAETGYLQIVRKLGKEEVLMFCLKVSIRSSKRGTSQ